jgi:ABC-2 type transport system permease protein/lipopolysaccharide transport system permease protein
LAITTPPLPREAGPPPEIRFRRRVGLVASVVEVWRARGMVLALTERTIRARYKQAFLGVAWVLVVPIMYMLVFSFFFSRVSEYDTNGVPYILFSYVGLLPWQFFGTSVANGSGAIIGNLPIVGKIFCPREVFPLTEVTVAFTDMFVSFGVLLTLFAATTTMPKIESLYVIPIFALQLVFTSALAIVASGISVHVRDVRNLVPMGLQMLLFITPVAYGFDVIPGHWRWVYSLVNPMAPILEGYRRGILYGQAPQWGYLGLALITTVFVTVGGWLLFKKLETTFADVA